MTEESLQDRLARLTSDMIKIDTRNPPGTTRQFADFLIDYLQSRGFSADSIEYEKDKPNVIAKVGSGSPVLILNGHMDVVPPGEPEMWKEARPFSGEIKDGKVYGRGATDMKGGLATIVVLFTDVAELVEKSGSGTLILAATADEEVGGANGMGSLVANGVLKGDAAIIAEPSGVNTISVGEKGLCQIELKIKGKSAHGSMPVLGSNAILKAVDALDIVSQAIDYFNSRLETPKELESAIEGSIEVVMEEASRSQVKLSRKEVEYVLQKITFNPGVMACGSKINMVPDLCRIEIDTRLPLGIRGNGHKSACEMLVDEMRAVLADTFSLDTFDVSIINQSEPNFTDPNSRIASILASSVERNLGVRPRFRIETGATDGRYLRRAGVPAVIYGPGEPFLAHSYDEYVKVEDLEKAYRVLRTAVLEFLGVNPAQ